MGKDNDAPPPPDLTPLVNANKESAAFANQNAKDQLAWSKEVYDKNFKVNRKFQKFVMNQMKKQSGWADADRARYEKTFQPLEDDLAKEALEYASPEKMEAEAGKAQAGVAQKFEQARQTAQEKLESYGVDPTQTRAGAMDLQSRVAEGAAQAAAGNMARDKVEAIGRQLRTEAINVGKGYPAQVLAETGSAQNSGNAGVSSGLATTNSGSQTMTAPSQWSNAGQNAINSWGNILNTGYGNEVDAWKAEQSSSSGIGQLVGLVAGTGLKAATGGKFGFAEGGIIPEFADGGMPGGGGLTNGDVSTPGGGPVPVERSPSGGVNPDDIAAVVDGGGPAKLSAGEFVIPEDVMKWRGEEWAQKEILKARKQMAGEQGERPAQPSMGPPIPMPV